MLRQQLEQVGMTLAETDAGQLELVARDDVPTLPRVFEEISDRLEAGHLTGPEEDVVSAIASGSLDPQRLSGSRSRALGSLLRACLIERSTSSPTTKAVATSDGHPSREPRASTATTRRAP